MKYTFQFENKTRRTKERQKKKQTICSSLLTTPWTWTFRQWSKCIDTHIFCRCFLLLVLLLEIPFIDLENLPKDKNSSHSEQKGKRSLDGYRIQFPSCTSFLCFFSVFFALSLCEYLSPSLSYSVSLFL